MSTASAQVSHPRRQQQKVSQAQRTAEAKAAFGESLIQAGSQIDSELQDRAKNIHANDKALTAQEKQVQKETKQLAKQADTLEKFVEKSKKQLASFEDLGGLHAGLEDDLADIEEMLKMIEEERHYDEREPDGAH